MNAVTKHIKVKMAYLFGWDHQHPPVSSPPFFSPPQPPQTWMSVNGRTTQAACTTVSTSLVITGVPATTDSTWHTTDTTVWVSKRASEGWPGFGGKGAVFSVSWTSGKKSDQKELHSFKRARRVSPLRLAREDDSHLRVTGFRAWEWGGAVLEVYVHACVCACTSGCACLCTLGLDTSDSASENLWGFDQ